MMQRISDVLTNPALGRAALALFFVCVIIVTLALTVAAQEPLRVRRNFFGSHNLAGPPTREVQVDWTAEMNGPGLVFEYVTWGWDTWIAHCFDRGLVPCMRLQNGKNGTLPNAGYMADAVQIMCDYKLAHPEYADRLVYLQLWNEPGDIRDYVAPDVFADFMVNAWTMIHQVEAAAAQQNPDIADTFMIMTPGQNSDDWWREAFNHNPQAKLCFDVWGTHPYPESDPPWFNHHDGYCNPDTVKCIDSYIFDLDECARPHGGITRRGFPVMITETAYGDHLGISFEGYPKTTLDLAAGYYEDALTERWYKWPEIIGVHHFIMANPGWELFGMVPSSSTSQDTDGDGVLEPVSPHPMYNAWKNTRISLENQGKLAAARLTPYRGPVGHIEGTVTRSDTGGPVKYATLYTDGYEFGNISLFDGGYRIENVPVGTYTLTCHKKCYSEAATQITVTQNQTTTANFTVDYQGKDAEEIYFIDSPQGGCDGDLYDSFVGQSFKTPADVGYIKFASAKPYVGDLYLKFTIIDGDNPNGTVVGTFNSYYLESAFGGEMIGGEAPGDGIAVQPNHTYFLKVERLDGQPCYFYASDSNPYPDGCCWVGNTQHPTWDLYGCYRGNRLAVTTDFGTIAGNVKNSSAQNLSGATVSTSPGSYAATTDGSGNYSIPNVAVGAYSVTASKSGYNSQTQNNKTVNNNQTTTVNFTLTCTAPSITTQPQSQTKSVGESVTFMVAASGTAPLSYQWRKNSANISGATSSSYTVASVGTSDEGDYDCVVTNACGSTTSNSATLTVNQSSALATEYFETMPSWNSSFDATWGSAASWAIASGGQSGDCLQVARSTEGSSVKAKVYTVPANTNITVSAYMKCPSFGSSYWMEFGYRLGNYSAQSFDQDAANWTLIKKFSNTGTNGNGNTWVQYSATVNTGSSTQISIAYKLGSSGDAGPTVGWDSFRIDGSGCTAPSITTQPQSQTKNVGESVTFTVTASGTTPLSYQWRRNSSNISGATSASYTISSVTTGDAGSYDCVVTNACGSATSNAATLTVATGTIASEDFTSIPSWNSSFDASWGGSASWTVTTGGQSGNFLQVARSVEGSSVKAKVYTVPTNTNITISAYMKCPVFTARTYWMEFGYRFGSRTAQDFDQNAGSWTLIKKFSNSGGYDNGNNDTWTNYSITINTGSNTQITIGYKLGASGGAGPTVGWDTFLIQ